MAPTAAMELNTLEAPIQGPPNSFTPTEKRFQAPPVYHKTRLFLRLCRLPPRSAHMESSRQAGAEGVEAVAAVRVEVELKQLKSVKAAAVCRPPGEPGLRVHGHRLPSRAARWVLHRGLLRLAGRDGAGRNTLQNLCPVKRVPQATPTAGLRLSAAS